jgi:hypothetical protein
MISHPQLKATNPADFVRVHGIFIGRYVKSWTGAQRQPVWIHFAKL